MWTCAEVEAARQEANRQAWPWGENGPSPQEVSDSRQRISAAERERFGAMSQENGEERHEQEDAKERTRAGARTRQRHDRKPSVVRWWPLAISLTSGGEFLHPFERFR
jgi:hypothetical protein